MRLRFFLSITCCVLGFSTIGHACLCISDRRPQAKSLQEWGPWQPATGTDYPIIFEGRVEAQEVSLQTVGPPQGALSMTSWGEHRVVTIAPTRVYRGPKQDKLTVITGNGAGDCGFDFETGKQYLVFASQMEGGVLFTSICTPTAGIEDAAPALRYLRGERPTAEDLLDGGRYAEEVLPRRFGTICGRVLTTDSKPVDHVDVELSQIRKDQFPSETFGDPDLSKADGGFCITATPGLYLLTGEKRDFDKGTRLMGYFPGTASRADAISVQVEAGEKLQNVGFTLREEPLCSILISVVTADGKPLPWANPREHVSILLEGMDRDALAYRRRYWRVEKDGTMTLNFMPGGRYTIGGVVFPSAGGELESAASGKWRLESKEIEVTANAEISLKLITEN